MRRLLLLGILALGAHAAPSLPLLPLKDGRVLSGRKVERRAKEALLTTDFGVLRVPAAEIGERSTTPGAPAPPPPPLRSEKTRWLLIENDLPEDRARLYADQLDAFFEWMIQVYGLDRDRVQRGAPYGVRVFRRFEEFKRFQRENAPEIERKGKAFAEGVAGFYSPAHGKLFLWDAEGPSGGFHLEVAKHETTHLLNDLLAQQMALRLPTWFDEGSATYFSMFVAGAGPEPEDHPGAAAEVLGDLDTDHAMGSRELRSVPWEMFHGREYSWGWALIRFFRQHARGARWPALLAYLRTISGGPVTDSEARRFLDAAGYKTSEAFDTAWHDELKATRTAERQYVGTSPGVLEKIGRLSKPSPAMARDFARIGISLARVQEPGPAIVYLRAALRGGIEDAEVPYQLARSLALLAAQPENAPWPDEALSALEEAVRLAPLASAYRLELGRQLLARHKADEASAMLGLALVLLGPSDDEIGTAIACLRAAKERAAETPVEDLAEMLSDAVPPAGPALRTAAVYYLQEAEEWEKLEALIQRRGTEATPEERAMLAGLYTVTDRCEDALPIYRELIRKSVRYWPDLVECLLKMDRKADAKAALKEAFDAVDKAPPELRWVRRRLERLRVD